MSICILVPSRGRPDRAAEMVASVKATSEAAVEVVLILDPDDPSLGEYRETRADHHILPERVGYTAALNAVAPLHWHDDTILGAFGDDVIFRTPGWDRIVESTLARPGLAYGDDLIHGVNHPSAVFMSSVIAKALGWLALPATKHQWADDAWKRLGQATGLLRYMPDVIVEHMHPAVDKAPMDETYAWNLGGTEESEARAKADFEGFTAWVEDGLQADAQRAIAAVKVAA